MFKVLAPLAGIVIAVGLFFTYVQPRYEDVQARQEEISEYDDAISKARNLQNRINELAQTRSSFELADLERLEAFLPDRIDEVASLIDIDALASSHGLALSNIEVTQEEVTDPSVEVAFDPYAMPPDAVDPYANLYRTLDVGFSVTGTYQSFRTFLEDLEQSLVLMEVVDIAFAVNNEEETDLLTVNMKVRLYSLEPPQP